MSKTNFNLQKEVNVSIFKKMCVTFCGLTFVWSLGSNIAFAGSPDECEDWANAVVPKCHPRQFNKIIMEAVRADSKNWYKNISNDYGTLFQNGKATYNEVHEVFGMPKVDQPLSLGKKQARLIIYQYKDIHFGSQTLYRINFVFSDKNILIGEQFAVGNDQVGGQSDKEITKNAQKE